MIGEGKSASRFRWKYLENEISRQGKELRGKWWEL